eukprot:1560792-Amphidinium_carterae.1
MTFWASGTAGFAIDKPCTRKNGAHCQRQDVMSHANDRRQYGGLAAVTSNMKCVTYNPNNND